MAEIPFERIDTKVITVDGDATVADVAQVYEYLPPEKRYQWHVIIRLGEDSFATLGLEELLEATAEVGPAIRGRPLRQLPDIRTSKQVERQGQGYGEARRIRNRSPRRRLVVLESGEPIGLLTDTERAGGFGGFMADLFGQVEQPLDQSPKLQIRCPIDGQMYDFADLIDLETNKLICPRGHVIEE
jgi:hypothetical protein